ncbi:MAG TPA: HD domain-containing protein [archaeon]|nr:HD domain-containing protein [archaeon]
MDIVNLSRELMRKQTKKNKAPAWLLTELAIEKGKEFSKKYNVNERLVLTSLYLAHTIFSPILEDDIQKNHTKLSYEFAKKYLDEWKVGKNEQKIILNAIEAHHNEVPTNSKVAEVVKNAECFKFVTAEGCLIFLHELGVRQVPFDESLKKVIQKMEQKKSLLTLAECKREAEENCIKILELFIACR